MAPARRVTLTGTQGEGAVDALLCLSDFPAQVCSARECRLASSPLGCPSCLAAGKRPPGISQKPVPSCLLASGLPLVPGRAPQAGKVFTMRYPFFLAWPVFGQRACFFTSWPATSQEVYVACQKHFTLTFRPPTLNFRFWKRKLGPLGVTLEQLLVAEKNEETSKTPPARPRRDPMRHWSNFW